MTSTAMPLRPSLTALMARALGAALSMAFPSVAWRGTPGRRLVAITFDDGPHQRLTPELLATLERHGARATFFLIGNRVRGNEPILRAIHAAGHELGNHLLTEKASILLGPARFEHDLSTTHDILADFGPVQYFRPASGWFTPAMLRRAARHGYRCALGTVTTLDSRVPEPARTRKRLLRWITPGSIVILHEGRPERHGVVALLDSLLSDLAERGYRCVTLSELMDRHLVRPGRRQGRPNVPPRS